MGQLPGELPVVRGGCVRGPRMCWFEKLLDAAYRNGATIIRARAGSKFSFRIGGETQVIGTHPVLRQDLIARLSEVLSPGLGARVRAGEDVHFEHAVVPWAPARAHVFSGICGLVMSVWLGQVEEKPAPPAAAPVFGDGDLLLTPSVRDIDRLLTAGLGLGASQLLLKPGARAVFRIGTEFHPISPNAVSAAEIERLLADFLLPMEAATLRHDGDVEVELAYPPFEICVLHVFLSGGKPAIVAQFPGVAVERTPAPEVIHQDLVVTAEAPLSPAIVDANAAPRWVGDLEGRLRGRPIPSPLEEDDGPAPAGVFALLPKNPPFKPRPALRAARPLPGPENRDEEAGSGA